jgi:hypothetical protein
MPICCYAKPTFPVDIIQWLENLLLPFGRLFDVFRDNFDLGFRLRFGFAGRWGGIHFLLFLLKFA